MLNNNSLFIFVNLFYSKKFILALLLLVSATYLYLGAIPDLPTWPN